MKTPAEQVIAESIDYLVAHYSDQPELSFLARRAGYEATHFQKLFTDKVGISPKRLIQYMNMRHARELLAAGHPTLETAHEAGLSSTGRLYDLFVSCEAVTPGDVQHKGRGLTVWYGYHPTPLGEIMIGATPRGVCYLGFLINSNRDAPFQKMKKHLPYAEFAASDSKTKDFADRIMNIWRGTPHPDPPPSRRGEGREGGKWQGGKLPLHLHGTNLQLQVWQALLKIPTGETLTYQDIARQIGKPKAARAIGNAVGANPVSLLIPCHRVIRATGIIDNYGWGSPRKKLLLGLEAEHIAHAV